MGYTEGSHGLEHPKWVALLEQLHCVSLVEGACDEQDDVVDHVPIAVCCVSGERGRAVNRTRYLYKKISKNRKIGQFEIFEKLGHFNN